MSLFFHDCCACVTLCLDSASTPTSCLPTQSPAATAVPWLAGPPQVQPSASGRRLTGSMPQQQLHQQAAQLSQQQMQHWYAQQVKAQQQQMLEQQLLTQQNFSGQQPAFSAAAQYDRDDVPVLSAAPPFHAPTLDTHQPQNVQETLAQQLLQQQMYEAVSVQQQRQQQQMKATVSAGAINLIQHQAYDGAVHPVGSGSCQFGTSEADHISPLRRASEGQVYTTSATCAVSSVQSVDSGGHNVTPAQSQSTDVIPPLAVTYTADNCPSEGRDETFKVPFPPDHVCY